MSATAEGEVAHEARALLEKLPLLLRRRPELRQQLYDLLSEQYVTRPEMAEVLAELKALRLDTNTRFEALQADMNRRFDQAERRDRDTRDWVGTVVGGFQRRAGRSLEDAVAGTLRVALQMKDLDPTTIQLRQKVKDTEGVMGPAGRSYEYDIFVTDGRACIFEVKSVPDEEQVERFADKCGLVARALGLQDPRRVLVTLDKTAELARTCERCGIELA